jgi:cytochrome c
LLLAAPADKTIWDGVYTTAQAERGKSIYMVHCQLCHADDLSGGSDGDDPAPALRHPDFAKNRKNLYNLYAYIKTSMPRDEPGRLDENAAIDVVAYLLRQNSLPAGAEDLKPDPEALKRILTEKAQ